MTNHPTANPKGGDQPGQRDEREKGHGGHDDKGGDQPGKVSPQEKNDGQTDDGQEDGATASAQGQPGRRPDQAQFGSVTPRGLGAVGDDATVPVEGRGGSGASDPTTNRLDNIETADDRTENLNPERDFGGERPDGS